MTLSNFSDAELKQLALIFKSMVIQNEYVDRLLAKYYAQAHLEIKRELLNRTDPLREA